MKKHIPNFITLLNVFCGCVAAVFAVLNQMELAAIFVFLGIVFDFFDGMAARLLDVKSELGLQLDSLADVITSGLVPGIVMFQLLGMSMSGGWNLDWSTDATPLAWDTIRVSALPFVGFLITMASAYRLAKFNIDTRQTSSFIGLAVPAHASFYIFCTLLFIYPDLPQIINVSDCVSPVIANPLVMLTFSILLSIMLIAEVPMFSLKFKNLKWKDNALPFTFILLWFGMLIFINIVAMPMIVIFYIVWSIILNFKNKTIYILNPFF